MHEVEKVMTHFGHKLEISEVGITLEDEIPVGKPVISTAVFLWQSTEAVTSSHGFRAPAPATPVLLITDFNSLLHQVWWVLLCDDTQHGFHHQGGSFSAVQCLGLKRNENDNNCSWPDLKLK